MTTQRARLFVASWDEMLLRSRSMMLGAFFSVQRAGRYSEAAQIVSRNPFDLLVLCHTLSDDEQEYLANIARHIYAPVEILALQSDPGSDKPYADYVYDVRGGPWELVTQCARIVGYTIKSKAHRVPVAG